MNQNKPHSPRCYCKRCNLEREELEVTWAGIFPDSGKYPSGRTPGSVAFSDKIDEVESWGAYPVFADIFVRYPHAVMSRVMFEKQARERWLQLDKKA